MTALLPPVFSSPFSGHFKRSPYIRQASDSGYTGTSPISKTITGSDPVLRGQQRPHTSTLSVVSAPVGRNDENAAPTAHGSIKISSRTLCAEDDFTKGPRKSHFVKNIDSPVRRTSDASTELLTQASTCGIDSSAEDLTQTQVEAGQNRTSHSLGGGPNFHTRARQARHQLTSDTTDTSESSKEPFPDLSEDSPYGHQPVPRPQCNPASVHKVVQNANLHSARRGQSSSTESDRIRHDGVVFMRGHRKYPSDTSSAFVHTLKTASFSNSSFQFTSRFRHGRSSDSQTPLAARARFSVDSERPMTATSVDDAAISRGLRRRQILVELSTTEEGYIADLRALLYLYSTLLASGNVNNHLRSSIHKNVLEILHLHERLLDQLHQLAYGAAARKWADTAAPHRLNFLKHSKWRSLDSDGHHMRMPHPRRTRSSISSADQHRYDAVLVAEPADVRDIATTFRNLILNFSVYEDYCANHEVVAHELQRHLPNLWSAYESGIESLARSVIALNHREHGSRKGLTVGDLLVKPIQRVCKYPLLFEDLLNYTPVADCPSAHTELQITLQELKEVVRSVNAATHDRRSRVDLQRRWLLQDRLNFDEDILLPEQFRLLGRIILCGVLHVTYQRRAGVEGIYAMCLLLGHYFLIALPAASGKYNAVCLIRLVDMDIVSASDGKGLQCDSALHTWKICFGAGRYYHELVLSACSKAEEDQWISGLQGHLCPEPARSTQPYTLPSSTNLDLKPIGVVFSLHSDLAGRTSVQRAATVGNRGSLCQVILRNTHNPHDFQAFRHSTPQALGRSQSHATATKVAVLSPKRSERVRMEAALADVWTRDKLPFPGMIASRGERIIRASAGSLVRKLSLASIRSAHATFSRRSASLSVSTRKSYEAFSEKGGYKPVFQIRKESFDEAKPTRKTPHDVPELDTMDSLIERMIAPAPPTTTPQLSTRLDLASEPKQERQGRMSVGKVGPDDPANMFYDESKERSVPKLEEALVRRKRWSNPIELLKNWSADGFRNMLYSTR